MTSFILSFAAKTPAEEIVRQAKSKGMSISLPYIYATRSKARRNDAQSNGNVRGALEEVTGGRRGADGSVQRDAHFAAMVRIVLDLGLAGTRDLLTTVESRLTSAVAKGA